MFENVREYIDRLQIDGHSVGEDPGRDESVVRAPDPLLVMRGTDAVGD